MSAGPRSDAVAEPFPWDAVLHVGLGLLRLSPRDFWRMSPREFAAAAGALHPTAAGAPGRLVRRDLEKLIERFPDGDGHGWHRQD